MSGSSALTLEEALRQALSRNPVLEAGVLDIQSAAGRVEQAGLRPNPEFAADLEARTEAAFRLSQRLETSGKRDARIVAAEAGRALARHDVETARLDLVREVRRDFALGIAAQRRLALARETRSIAQEVAASAQRKVEAGALPMVEATRARVAIATSEIEHERAASLVRVALERLALHWGGSPSPGRLEGELDSLPAIPGTDSLIALLASSPDLARWERAADLERARLLRERSLRTPDLTIGGGYRRSLTGDGDGATLVGLSLDLPLANRNQGAILEASAGLARASFEREKTRRLLERELREQTALLEIAQSEVRALRREVLPGAREVFESIREGYTQGRFTYLDLLEARRTLAEIGEAEIDALSELEQHRIAIDRLVGRAGELPPREGEKR